MAEPVRRRGRRPRGRGGGVGRGARGAQGGRGRPPRIQQPPARHSLDTVLVDLVSDSDEDVLEVSTACDVADPAEVPPPASPVPAKPRDDSDSDSEGSEARPAGPPRAVVRQRRRRLVLDPETAPVVPVYSGKVQSSLQLIPDHLSLLKLYPAGAEEDTDVADSSSSQLEDSLTTSSPWKKKLRSSDEDKEKEEKGLLAENDSLPPSAPRNKSRKHSRALKKLREVNKRLHDLRSTLSPKQQQEPNPQGQDDEVVLVEGPAFPEHHRLFPLKIRCRADLVRLPVRMSEPLQSVVDHMATHLGVSPSRILLLFGETELSPTATPRTLKLGVADIIDCVVLASSSEAKGTTCQQLQLRVQGKEKHQTLEVSLSPASPLKTLMSRYEEAMGLCGHKLSFFFDGTKLSGKELPGDLGMENGDLIEVWS
ncbi:NFATC2-interacting protein [Ochotona princeps]|uniref:NFATC2-interacting protein n=1 Tax=Ochotona princeps TaxID=9978 RepID=UPI00271545DA|nr:NFATC2-interacting protein [Ochotona princeps]